MSRWYCEEHRDLDKNPNRVITFYEGMNCHVLGCKNKLRLKQ
jgi:hypothetical protein